MVPYQMSLEMSKFIYQAHRLGYLNTRRPYTCLK